MRAAVGYLARYRRRYAVGIALLLLATGLSLGIPWTVQRAIDALAAGAGRAGVLAPVGLILLLAAANGAARLGSRLAIVGGAQRIEHDLRAHLYASLLRYPPAWFVGQSTGDLMARAGSDAAAVRSLLGFGVVSLVTTAAAFVGGVGAMLAIDPRLTLVALAPYPLLALGAQRAYARIHARTEAAQEQLGAVSGVVQEHLAGMAVVRAYVLERRALARFTEAHAEYRRRSLALARTLAAIGPRAGLVSGLGVLAVLWLGGQAVIEGRLTLGALVAFNGYLAYLAWPTLALGYTLSLARRGLTSMGRVQAVIAGAPPVVESPRTPPLEPPLGIRFDRLTFAYPGRPPVLREVSFTVEPGRMAVVVGPTGSGKSTLAALLVRLWEPPPGTVYLGGRDVRDLPLETLRGALGWVPQEAFLFSRSVLDNVTLGREGISPAAARRAAALAAVADEVETFPAGWHTVVGERGLTLSGGQRQRLALGRALAARPPVLVLDDPFASVDAAREEEILRGLREAGAGCTVLVMTHRLRAAQYADQVVVLAGGRVVEVGAHEALLARGGLYARLWRQQQLEAEIARA